jgi:chromatin remodeling complex protein RSC6
MKPVKPDDKLAAVIGSDPIPRTEVTRKVWDYIRSHNLQDPKNRTVIQANDQLKQVFDGKNRVTMFEMTKLVFQHCELSLKSEGRIPEGLKKPEIRNPKPTWQILKCGRPGRRN